MKLTKLLKALTAAKSAVAELKTAGVKVPRKLVNAVSTADLVASELNGTLGSSSRASSNDGAK